VGEVTPNQFLLGTSLLAMMGLSDDPALQLLAAQRFVHEKVPKPPAVPLHLRTPPRSGKVRIGYLSGDLHMHAVGLLTPELFELHDRSRFEVCAFCWTPESASRSASASCAPWTTSCASAAWTTAPRRS
jgi:predicted O-linked N-acetylglucosamine transferase (SPINDLY family)